MVMDKIKNKGTGMAFTTKLGYLYFGYFLIDTEILGLHPTQKIMSQKHVKLIVGDFERLGVHLVEHPGVVIGLGDG